MKRLIAFVRVRWTMLVRSVKARAGIELTNSALNGYYQLYKLDKTTSPELLFQILQGALKDSNRLVKTHATFALGELGDSRAIPALINALKGYEPIHAAVALAKLGDERAIPTLVNALNDDSRWVRDNAAEALKTLVELGDSRALPPLMNVLNYGEIKCDAAQALAKLGQQGISTLINALNDLDDEVRNNAAFALGESEDSRAIPALINALNNDNSSSVQANAAKALAKLGEQGVSALINAFNDLDDEVRRYALFALGESGDNRAVPTLINALNDDSGWG